MIASILVVNGLLLQFCALPTLFLTLTAHAQRLPPVGDPDLIASARGWAEAEALRTHLPVAGDPSDDATWAGYRILQERVRGYETTGIIDTRASDRERHDSYMGEHFPTSRVLEFAAERDAFCFANSGESFGPALYPFGEREVGGSVSLGFYLGFAGWQRYGASMPSADVHIRERRGFLGDLGSRRGICSGMSIVMAALRSNATFQCGGARPSSAELIASIEESLDLYRTRQSRRVTITGYCGLRQACYQNAGDILDLAIDLNALNAVSVAEWSPLLSAISGIGDGAISGTGSAPMSCSDSRDWRWRQNGLFLRQVFSDLSRGRFPVIQRSGEGVSLARLPHATVATGFYSRRIASGEIEVHIEHQDPNNPSSIQTHIFRAAEDYSWAYEVSAAGEVGEYMHTIIH